MQKTGFRIASNVIDVMNVFYNLKVFYVLGIMNYLWKKTKNLVYDNIWLDFNVPTRKNAFKKSLMAFWNNSANNEMEVKRWKIGEEKLQKNIRSKSYNVR